ncbi:MAG: EAL domain-containing protein, partial [Syntrophomonadaceae bacterium]|nr:EAL domain-containing protein [Syntrophomonadaceae bacterium]
IKYINESYGHEAGDRYIAAAAKILCEYEKDGLVARIAGDEFAVYIHGYEGEADISAMEKEVSAKFAGTTVDIGDLVKIRASFGVALYPQDAITVDNLLKFAGHTMFEVKSSNRGSFMRFSAATYQKKANLFDRQEKLNQLIDGKQIKFAFQPIFRLDNCSLYGYEALMRSCTDSFSGPLDILALAEAQSKLNQLEKVTFEVMFDWLGNHLSQLEHLKIFFNTISTQYMALDKLEKIHPRYKELCKYIVFEVLENTAGSENFVREINAFRQQFDAMVAIDDYGCGYSNDLRLISVAPDIVKIDRFLIKGIDSDKDKRQLLQKIVGYCKAKGIATLAEGIETPEELQAVIQLGFVYAQGYYLGLPDFHLAELPNAVWTTNRSDAEDCAGKELK